MVGLASQIQSHVGQLTDQGGPFPSKIFGYEVIDRLGFGAASSIYVVTDPATRQLRALKHVIRKTEKDARFIDQLTNEFDVARKVNHPTLRRVVELKLEKTLFRTVTSAALVMELFDGAPLTELNFVDAADVFSNTAEALAAMHACGYVHCDIKPANILRSREGEVRVIDLGQACPIGTVKDRIQGTADFIAPEQVKRHAVDQRTDVYNFGATLYNVLTGQKIPTLINVDRGANSFITDALIKTPTEFCPVIPESLSQLVMECVRVNAAKRPGDMAQIAKRLKIMAAKFGGR